MIKTEDEDTKKLIKSELEPVILSIHGGKDAQNVIATALAGGASDTVTAAKDNHRPPIFYKCNANHELRGFEGRVVYVYDGPLKGRLGRVKQMSGGVVQVEIETAFRGEDVLEIEDKYLVSKCSCMLNRPYWQHPDLALVQAVFESEGATEAGSSTSLGIKSDADSKPLKKEEEEEKKIFHDPDGEGMWLLDPAIAELRKTYTFILFIMSHTDTYVSGQREGHVHPDPSPLMLPLPASIPTVVLVRYKHRNSKEIEEALPVANLRVTKPKTKGLHAIIRGEHKGKVVRHIKTINEEVKVFFEGTDPKKGAFLVNKNDACVVQTQ